MMRIRTIRVSIIVVLLLVLAGGYFFQKIKVEAVSFVSEDPRVWASVIQSFRDKDTINAPPENAIVFVGSSSIRFWTSLSADMKPLVAFGRGFGGAKINDVSYYVDQLISPYDPKAIVVYVGSNDLSNLVNNKIKTPEQVKLLYQQLIARLKAVSLAPVYFIALKPTRQNWPEWTNLEEVNRSLQRITEQDDQLHFINANTSLLHADGELNEELISWDGIHMNSAGYKAWSKNIKQRLMLDLGAT